MQKEKTGIAFRKIVNQEIKSIIVPELRRLGFQGTFPHYKRIFETGKVDYLSFQFNKYGGSFIVEFAVAYPYKGSEGNFYYWDEITPEVVKKSNYGNTRERLRIKPQIGEWFALDESNVRDTVNCAFGMMMKNIHYFDP